MGILHLFWLAPHSVGQPGLAVPSCGKLPKCAVAASHGHREIGTAGAKSASHLEIGGRERLKGTMAFALSPRPTAKGLAFAAIAFAGGGNRCYWQGGVWESLAAAGLAVPRLMVGVSGGGWAATYSVAGIGPRVRELVMQGCRSGTPNMVPSRVLRGQSPFPVGGMYRELLVTLMTPDVLVRLHQGPEILLKVARPPAFLPAGLAAAIGILGYQVEKALTNRLHPRVGRRLGFRPDWISTHALETPADLVAALMATSSVPPFMPIGRVGGARALDGGLVDNVPVEKLQPFEAAGEPTLVLVTRRYANLPEPGLRTYLQPSAPVPVGKFDVTNAEGIRLAYELGLKDGAAFAASRLG
jgi:hypothetical protein